MNFLFLTHSPGRAPQTVKPEDAHMLQRKQEEAVARWRRQRPPFLRKWLLNHHPAL